MDLTKQPPRRPSNTIVAGIAGLARMTDKARASNNEKLGDFKYGDDSGLDREVLGLIGIDAKEFAIAAGDKTDDELSEWVISKVSGKKEAISQFNQEEITREPQDDLHVGLLKERLAKFAPDRNDIKTVFASIELDDWGCFKDRDLTQSPPRSPYVRDVFSVVGVARMADKARASMGGKLGEYQFGENSGLDKRILDFTGIDADHFREAAYTHPNDCELSEWLGGNCKKNAQEISIFNAHEVNYGRYGMALEQLKIRRTEIHPDRADIETFFDLMDLDDETCFGLTDLSRHAPRSVYDETVGGVAGLARMIDKYRALHGCSLGDYWVGEDSGFDRSILEFLDLSSSEFSQAVERSDNEDALLNSLDNCLGRKSAVEKTEFNNKLLTLGPDNDQQLTFFCEAIRNLDPKRRELRSWAALTTLDDQISFARLKVGT
ncbi:MAG: hypothetical protein DF168_00666 [Candidatus Moanabacter tarae]|uniref:DUF5069 domain-containing protein n=1 Tax=Candidatus Moanibacter tarae TaxID=2200854 RepID=A0A2Z4AEV5_9BACT|nr:MAG: hypothetical protein DF168_00666 [Candidatus Moanabacter tarae]|tara:strand:+ start:29023 stop:30324 length:1302 start_codon:yes stop_codon:yes gene_type:complete